jgi:hypothetical protein
MAFSSSTVHTQSAAAAAGSPAVRDSLLTVCAVSVFAHMIDTMIHEGLGHGCVALLTVSRSGVLSTLAWSATQDSKLVDAGGTLANLAFAGIFWLLLRNSGKTSAATRMFLLLACAFNLFSGTGYFFFSGITNFGDWAMVIQGMQPHLLWRILLIVIGILAYLGALVVIGAGLVRYAGVPLSEHRRITRLMLAAYLSAVLMACISGLLNPLGVKYVLLSALPAAAGAGSGLLYMQWYVRKNVRPLVPVEPVNRSSVWIGVSALCALPYIFVLGRGIHLAR